MPSLVAKDYRSLWMPGLVVATIAASLLAANSLATGTALGTSWTGTSSWPEPLSSIKQLLAIESWPTYDAVEIRWFAWAIGAAALGGLALLRRRKTPVDAAPSLFPPLLALCAILALLVLLRALFSAVPVVGLMWTWQCTLALVWMLLLYVWTVRLPVLTVVRTVALWSGGLSALSLLFCIQAGEANPNWPTGNVLFLTTACLAGVFLTASWLYASISSATPSSSPSGATPSSQLTEFVSANHPLRQVAVLRRRLLTTPLPALLLAMILVVLIMAGRRAAILGLAAGFLFILVLLSRRTRLLAVGLILATFAAGLILAPRLHTAGRWETILYRVEMYRSTAAILVESPLTPLVGVGPNHLGFPLTTKMRELHAEHPRLFHGQLSEEAHSEPLQAIAELGLPLGLLYLALPLGGLIGFALSYRRTTDPSQRLTILGAGAALAATLAAEATSVGMRHPGVAMLVWALVGVGWACGAQVGGFALLVRWFQPVTRALSFSHEGIAPRVTAAVLLLVLLALAWQGLLAGGYLYQAHEARNRRQYSEASRLLDRVPIVPTSGDWMAWQHLQAQVSLVLMEQAQGGPAAAPWRTRALRALAPLVDVCPAYRHAPVLLSMAYTDWADRKKINERFLRYDPYNMQARLTQASYPDATPSDQMNSLRLGIRNACLDPNAASLAAQVLKDPAAQQMLTAWLADAARALQQPDPAEWSDPLSLETLRIAVMLAGLQGNLVDALDRANEAASLLDHLSHDPRRNRPEAVETEVHLDQAWFAWLLQPAETRKHAEALEAHLQRLPEPTIGSFSRNMASQFAAMLRLALGEPDRANRSLYLGDPTIRLATMRQVCGLASARLVVLVGSRVSPEQSQAWARQGRTLLGDSAWIDALQAAAARGLTPWWFGVLPQE